jgi:hypothetical protein
VAWEGERLFAGENMNLSKYFSNLVIAATALSIHSALLAADNRFSGSWEYVEYVAGSSKPYSTFDIKLNETNDGAITGSYCFVTQNGNRTDCSSDGVNNISGRETEDGRAEIDFYSFFGAKDGVAELMSSGDTLKWTVTKNPTGDFFYGPYSIKLNRKQVDVHQGERQVIVDRAYLYPTPSETKVKMYVVRGDYVKLIEISADLKFWKISYAGSGGITVIRWIDCRAIGSCP